MSIENPSRRTVLRGFLATGLALCLPNLSHAATNKLTKAQAHYQDQPKGDQKCSNCRNFIAPNACAVVEGTISPQGWCVLWVEK